MTGRDPITVLDDSLVEHLLTGGGGSNHEDLQQVVALLRSLPSGPAPAPSAALADLLDNGFEPTVLPFRRPSATARRWVARTGTGLVAAAASLVVAGTAAALPAPLQEFVADLVSAVTPFELPRPDTPNATSSPDEPLLQDQPTETADPATPIVPSTSTPAQAITTDPPDSADDGGHPGEGASTAEHTGDGERAGESAGADTTAPPERDERPDVEDEGFPGAPEESASAPEDVSSETAHDAENAPTQGGQGTDGGN